MHFKYIRIKPKNPRSYKNLINKPIMKLLFNKSDYQYLLAESFILLIRDINTAQNLNVAKIKRKLNKFIQRLKIEELKYENLHVPDHLVNQIINELHIVYTDPDELSAFKGDILEFYMLQIYKNRYKKARKSRFSDIVKLKFEPIFYFKRRSLFRNSFPGENCDMDIVRIEKFGEYMELLECKFNLDGNIIKFQNNNRDMVNKITYIDEVENVLKEFENDYGEKVKVKKSLASFTDVNEMLTGKLLSYNVLNVREEFKEMLNSVL